MKLSSMTERVKVGLIGVSKFGQRYAESLAFRIPELDLVAVSNMFLEAAEKFAVNFQIPTVYNDHPLILTDNLIETRAQFIKESGSTNSFYFPPFCCREQEQSPAPAS